MTLAIPFNWTNIDLNTTPTGDLEIVLRDSDELNKCILNQLLYNMSYDDIINTITPQSFEQIVEHYNTEYEKE